MTKSLRFLASVALLAACAGAGAPAALGAETCPNETVRAENNSTALPDCRAYELVSPDSNHALIFGTEPPARFDASQALSAPDGNTMLYTTIDAPEDARSGEALANRIHASRDPAMGWSGFSLSPPVVGPVTAYLSIQSGPPSRDMLETFDTGNQPFAGGASPAGFDVFVRRADGTYRLLTPIPAPSPSATLVAGNADYSHVYFLPAVAQLPNDNGNVYSWSEANGLHLVGILPDGTPAPDPASLAGSIISPISADATKAVFVTDGKLYLRIDDEHTAEVSASQRTIEPDPNPGPALVTLTNSPAVMAGVTADGSNVLFVAHSELTDDAHTGRSGGVATDAGADLYRYDAASGHLTDLTVDTNPADTATGANVQQVLGATSDGSYIYFTAGGSLASGANPGHVSLYVWHEGSVNLVANADGFRTTPSDAMPRLYVTPDGLHAAFASSERLTAYDNTDPITGQPHSEIYEATLGRGIQCVSCRVNGSRPRADTFLSRSSIGPISVVSDDGRRVFFESNDAVVPQAGSGLAQVFEYEDGSVWPVSRLDSSSRSTMLAASASGNDVFIATFDDPIPGPTAGESAVFDARVGGGFPVTARHECSGVACQGTLGSAPTLTTPTSSSDPGNLVSPPPTTRAKPRPKPAARQQKLARALKTCNLRRDKKKRSSCKKSARKRYGRRK